MSEAQWKQTGRRRLKGGKFSWEKEEKQGKEKGKEGGIWMDEAPAHTSSHRHHVGPQVWLCHLLGLSRCSAPEQVLASAAPLVQRQPSSLAPGTLQRVAPATALSMAMPNIPTAAFLRRVRGMCIAPWGDARCRGARLAGREGPGRVPSCPSLFVTWASYLDYFAAAGCFPPHSFVLVLPLPRGLFQESVESRVQQSKP